MFKLTNATLKPDGTYALADIKKMNLLSPQQIPRFKGVKGGGRHFLIIEMKRVLCGCCTPPMKRFYNEFECFNLARFLFTIHTHTRAIQWPKKLRRYDNHTFIHTQLNIYSLYINNYLFFSVPNIRFLLLLHSNAARVHAEHAESASAEQVCICTGNKTTAPLEGS